jgi:endonuclease/exonuclease/phosphatase family metal-dependent hydrolase
MLIQRFANARHSLSREISSQGGGGWLFSAAVRPLLFACVLALFLGGCKEGGTGGADDPDGAPPGPDADHGGNYPPPRSDLVPAIGSPGAVDIAAWNIENFPRSPDTPSVVADLVTSLGLDLVAVEEIASVDAFDELVARLPDHEAILSSHTYSEGSYQKVGFIYNADLMTVDGGALLFDDQGYDFPRPPLQVHVTVDDGSHPAVEFIAIVVHLKAGIGDEDRARRTAAVEALEAHIRELVGAGQSQVMLMGDFNERVDTDEGRAVFDPFLDAPSDYSIRTLGPAEAGEVTYLPFGGRFIDHIVTTAGLADEMTASDPVVPPLDQQLPTYGDVSDHLPVATAMPVLQ